MKKLTLITLSFCILLTGEVLAKEITLNQILSSTSKVNATAVQKTSTPNFKENCRGSGSSMSGQCIIEYDGAVYFGDVKYGKPNGRGIQQWTDNGSIYVGEFSDSQISGYGTFIWDDGTYFQGYIHPTNVKSTGIIFQNDLSRPAIYVGEVSTDNISSRMGYGVQHFYQPGVQHDLTSDAIESYATVFVNNKPQSNDCIYSRGENVKKGKCINRNGSRDFNFENTNYVSDLFLKNLDSAINQSIENFDKAEKIANETYQVAFGEEIIEREEKKIVKPQETQPQIQLDPIEGEYVAIKNANVRIEPYVGASVVTTIPEGTTVYVPGKVKGENWLAIEGESGIIGYSFGTLFVTKQEFAQQQGDLKKQLQEIAEAMKEEEPQFWGSGTGFYVTSEGHIVTNWHVTRGCMYLLHGEEKLKVIRNDVVNDLALLKSVNPTKNFLRISNKIVPLKGEDIFVIGYPFGKLAMFSSSGSKVTKGIVSNLQGLNNDISQFQIDAAIQPGNSGGPVFDTKGALVGVAVSQADYKKYIEAFERLPQNMNFAIKSIMLENFLSSFGITYEKKDMFINKSQPEIVNAIDKATVYLECWTTEAKAEEAKIVENIELVNLVRAERAKNK